MQTEVPTLPVVHLNANKNVNRKDNPDMKSSSMEEKPCKSTTCPSSNRKCLHPLLGGPYRSNVKQPLVSERSKQNKNNIGQRVLSAKMLRVKQLQNQLADAHYHLNEIANENRLLKALQKRQDSALRRYEGTNAELPRIINSHHEELRVLQSKYKKLKAVHKETCELLKEKENELQHLQSQNKHLLQLSKDRNLGEREKLQLQVTDLNHRIHQQQETIQTLHRKLELESKSLKHQLHMEVTKRRETQRILQETEDKLRTLECLLDNRERRLYSNGQLPTHPKERRLASQSLTNLGDVRDKKWQKDVQRDNLPLLNASESNDDENVNKSCSNRTPDSVKTETMASLQQIRKYRLQRSSHAHRSSFSLEDREQTPKELSSKVNSDSTLVTRLGRIEDQRKSRHKNVAGENEIRSDEFRRIFDNRRYTEHDRPSAEYNCSSEETDSENEKFRDNYYINATKNSREFHARLVSSTEETSDTPEDSAQKAVINENTGFDRSDNVPCTNYTFEGQLRNKDFYETDSEVETSNMKTQLSQHFSPANGTLFRPIPNYESLGPGKVDSDLKRTSDLSLRRISEEIRRDSKTEDQYANDTLSPKGSKRGDSPVNDETPRLTSNYSTNCIRKSSKDLENNISKPLVSAEQEINGKAEEEGLSDRQGEGSKVEKYLNVDNSVDKYEEMIQEKSPKSPQTNLLGPLEVTNEDSKKTTNEEVSQENFSTSKEEETTKHMSCAENPTDRSEQSLNKSEDSSANKGNGKSKLSYSKEKLLATMKAIDNNENIEFLPQNYQKYNSTSRKQITENLFRGLPTQSKRKQDIIKDIFETDSIESKARSTCSKLH